MNWTGKRFAEMQTAFMLLTRLPVGELSSVVPKLADARWAFPIVGCVIGGLISGSYIIISQFIQPSVLAAILAITVGLLCTGAIHEDGLADCADGLGGGQTKENKLAIMQDSVIGSYGTLSLILIIGLRVFTLSSLPATVEIIVPIIICAVISRFGMVGYLYLLPSAKKEGLGSEASGNNIYSLLASCLIVSPAFFIAIFSLIYVIIAVIVVAFLWGVFTKNHLGGQTGDVCGAGQILSETAGWLILASIYGGL